MSVDRRADAFSHTRPHDVTFRGCPIPSRAYLDAEDEDEDSDEEPQQQPLRKIAVPWISPVPITQETLKKRRREFWETAPSYGGREEVWQAIHAAVDAGNAGELENARIMIECVGLMLPNGLLTEAYDERGFCYVIPPFCLADPLNVSESDSFLAENADRAEEKDFCVRTSAGEDIHLNIRADQTVADIIQILQKRQKAERVELFWQGHQLPHTLHPSSLSSNLLQAFVLL